MTFDELQALAEKDLKLNDTELDLESLKTPQLHNKYCKFHNQYINLLKKAEQTPKNLEIFMLLEELFKTSDKHQEALDKNIHTQIKLDHLEEQLTKALNDIEKLKDKVRQNGNSHSSNNVSG